MIPFKKDIAIRQGTTFSLPIRWEVEPYVYKPITAISQTAPCVVTSPNHGVPDGWRVAVVSAKGMTQINALNTPPKDSDYTVVTHVDSNTLELNTVNAAGFKPYTSGGYLMYRTPKDLAGFTARMSIKDKVGGTELLELTTENLRITLDDTSKTVLLTITATDTAAITWAKGVYDLELASSAGVVSTLLYGAVSVVKEVTL